MKTHRQSRKAPPTGATVNGAGPERPSGQPGISCRDYSIASGTGQAAADGALMATANGGKQWQTKRQGQRVKN